MCANTSPTYYAWAHQQGFTKREAEVFYEYATHTCLKEVSACMDISIKTVKNHVTNIYRKLDVFDSLAAYRAAGWLTLP